jgi:hypothetical protein
MDTKYQIIEHRPSSNVIFQLERKFDTSWNFMSVFNSIDELMWLHKFLTEFLLSKGYDPNDKEYFEEE